ncbi:hypothetical protein TKK_0012873 [Trichogramma kaykai]|uniref:Fatty acid hydroxylase domain-containing protein n=1 Tax=Trichogramma kaykai TaxID=54128 RepID=A0ABD2WL12_9HYME
MPDTTRSEKTTGHRSASTLAFVILVATIGYSSFKMSASIAWCWTFVGDYLQAQWNRLIDTFGDDPALYWIYGTTLVAFVTYWFVGGLFLIVDLTGFPSFIRRYKIQPGVNEPVAKIRMLPVLFQVLFNQIVVGLPVAYGFYRLVVWRQVPELRQLPSFRTAFGQLLTMIVIEEIGFYYSHRLLHHPSIYRFVHKRHHEWQAPIAIVSIYCHPLEHVLSNLLPIVSGILIVGAHVFVAKIWIFIAIVNTLNSHSGYHLPFAMSPEMHDFHHLKFTECYGILGVLDFVHGTDRLFRQTKAYQRNIISFSLKPLRELISDRDQDLLDEETCSASDSIFQKVPKTFSPE